ncbi:unnamed protein product [Rotaria sp. Silwood2]|nr:unnamed protein product [Rotaria sp. Silwood2]CAF4434561.1 unnamed protein product [Rotaria sp. Silwood2]
MLDKNPSSLLSLPVELLHHIFDHLDVQTILLALSSVCTQLRSVVYTYERYVLDLRSISKNDFYHICYFIRPINVISLILSDNEDTPGQSKLFLSIFDIRQFIRLRSLALFLNDDDNLDTILNHAINCSLNSLVIERPCTQTHRNTTLNALSSIMTKCSLRTLTCTIDLLSADKFKWPLQCTVEHIIIDRCMRKQFCLILDNLPNLRTIIIHNFNLDINHECNYTPTPHLQLTSLTMKQVFLSMDKLESFFYCTPSLVHLRLEGSADNNLFDGSRWEKLIRTKLPLLNHFEFCFRSQNSRIIKLSTVEFRTPFWLEERRWPVNFIYDTSMEELLVCSIPDFLEELEYQFCGPTIVSTTMHNSTITMAHVS